MEISRKEEKETSNLNAIKMSKEGHKVSECKLQQKNESFVNNSENVAITGVFDSNLSPQCSNQV